MSSEEINTELSPEPEPTPNEVHLDETSESADTEQGFFEHHRFLVDPGQGMMRIDMYINQNLKNTSRSRVKKAAMAGCLLVNDRMVKASYKVKPGDEIAFVLPYPPRPDITAENVPINIHYEDDDIVMVNKHMGLVVHPGISNWTGTMVHGLLYHFNGDVDVSDREKIIWPGLVHRIDKDTTGLLVVAKTEDAMYHLSQQFYEHTTDRNYYAIVWGDVKVDEGTIEANVGRSVKDRKVFTVPKDPEIGRHAITHFKVIERFGIATLVQCTLDTGRTHQIRVHMKHIGHTLFGDKTYGGDRALAGPGHHGKYQAFVNNCFKIMQRQALHARTLGFIHPGTQKKVNFESELPEDFVLLIEKLRGFAKTYF